MTERETRQARQAALLLHGLPPEARHAVLRRMAPAEAQRLQAMLSELTELGVSQSLGRQLQDLVAGPEADATVATVQESADRLSAVQVELCLRACAPSTVAWLLAARAWSWQTRVLELMPEARRIEVVEHLDRREVPTPAALTAFLCERLLADAALHGEPAEPRGAGTMRRYTGLLRRILRRASWTH